MSTASTTNPEATSTALLVAAFAALYVTWGSTYLAIRIAVETMPPFLMASVRFILAGGLLMLFLRWRGEPWPGRRQWRTGAVVGTLLLLGGNGLVSWAEQSVASGLAALIVATTPLWFVLLEALPPWRKSPARSTLIGLALGFAGVLILVGPIAPEVSDQAANQAAEPDLTLSWAGVTACLAACLLWATGSLYQRHVGWVASPMMNAAVQMICGSAALLLAGTFTGEWSRADLATISARSAWAWLYLIVFGSWIGFGSYIWLLKHTTPSRLSTYAYVNPIIAVLLGWFILKEPITTRVVWASLAIIAGVVLVQWPKNRR